VTNTNGEQIKEKILKILKVHPEGLTIDCLSEMVGAHRQTITKYIFWLDGAGLIHRRRVGSATLHYLKKFIVNLGEE
jgi:DNA-binding transcriptional ArsR family regulator